MKEIGQFLDKFKNSTTQEIQKRTIVCKAIHKFVGQEIPIECISFVNKTIKTMAPAELKSEIYIKKKSILKEISLRLPNIKIIDIK